MSIYRKIFGESWLMAWNNKYWWLLGLCAVFFGSSVELEIFDSFFSSGGRSFFNIGNSLSLFDVDLAKQAPNLLNDLGGLGVLIGAFLVISLFLALVVIAAIMSQIILVAKTNHLAKNKSLKEVDTEKFGKLILRLKDYLLPVVSVNLVYKIVAYLALIAISLPVIFTIDSPSLLADYAYVFSFVLLIPVAITFGMVVKFSVAYMICDDLPWRAAIKSAWRLFIKNWLTASEVSLMQFLIFIFFSLASLMIGYSLMIILSLAAVLISPVFPPIMAILSSAGYVAVLLIFIWAGSFVTTFNIITWTNFFLKLKEKSLPSKIMRVVGGWQSKSGKILTK